MGRFCAIANRKMMLNQTIDAMKKRRDKRFLLLVVTGIILLLLSVLTAPAQTTYYLDSRQGDDRNTGTSETSAWKTLDKLNTVASQIKPGDKILLKRGSRFFGQISLNNLGSDTKSIAVDAYGSGELPVITGARTYTGWKQYQGLVYKAVVKEKPLSVYVNNILYFLARTPNAGNWFTADNSNSTTWIGDAELTQPAGSWKGATCRVRTSDYTWDYSTVSSYTPGSLTMNPGVEYTIQPGYIYYLENTFSSLDAPGEWYWRNDTLYVYLKDVKDTAGIQACSKSSGLYAGSVKNLTVKNIVFEYQTESAVYLNNCSSIEISGCTIRESLISGIECKTGDQIRILSNQIRSCYGKGISATSLQNSIIDNNTVKQIGLVPGYGKNGYDGAIGIFINHMGSSNKITSNRVDSTGYSGIRSDSRNTLIEHNVVSNALMTLKDGAGIYIWGDYSKNTTIRQNYIENIHLNESIKAYHNWGFGIYLDDYSIANKVTGNIINDRQATAIFLHNSLDNTVDSNTVYGGGLSILIDRALSSTSYANTVVHNTFFTINPGDVSLLLSSSEPTTFGNFDYNIYANPFSRATILHKVQGSGETLFNLSGWRAFHGQDAHSSESPVWWSTQKVTDTLSADLLKNGTFTTNLNDWWGYPDNFQRIWKNDGKMDGGYVQMRFLSSSPTYGAFLSSQNISYTAGTSYLISFSAKSDKPGTIQLKDDADNPVQFNYAVTCDTARAEYRYIFTSGKTTTGKFLFGTSKYFDATMYFDNIHLYKVATAPFDPYANSRLLVNPSLSAASMNTGGNAIDAAGTSLPASVNLAPWKAIVCIYDGNAGNSQPDPVTDPPATVADSLQNLRLEEGWNMVSFYVVPADDSLSHIFAPLMAGKQLIKVQDRSGRFMTQLPDGTWFSNLERMHPGEGYHVWMRTGATMQVKGSPVKGNISIPLVKGQNLIGYPSKNPSAFTDLFASLIERKTFYKLKDDRTRINLLQSGKLTIGVDSLKPGEGYYVTMTAPDFLTTGTSGDKSSAESYAQAGKGLTYFSEAFPGDLYAPMNFVLTGFQGTDGLKTGDEIGIFDGELCVGAAVYDGSEVFGMSASMTDPSSDIPLPGFTEGHTCTLRFWNHERLQEYKNLTWTATAGYPLAFAGFGTAFITFTGAGTTEVTAIDAMPDIIAYPNPFRETVTLRVQLTADTDVSFAFYDATGRLADRIDRKALPAGEHTITWKPEENGRSNLGSGIYLVRITTREGTKTLRLMQVR